MRHCYKYFALLLGLLLLVSALPVGVSAAQEGDYTYSVSGGHAIITGYSGSASALTIPATLGGYPVEVIGKKAFYNNKTLTSVTIPASVNAIESQAFAFCSGLTSLSVASGNDTFYAKNNCIISYDGVLTVGCKKSVIPQDGSVTVIGEYAFGGMSDLTSVTLPASLTKILTGAFFNCKKLGNVTLPSKLTNLGTYAFGSCEAITSVRLPASLRVLEGTTFSGCSKLKTLTVESGNSLFSGGGNCIINSRGVLVAGCNGSTIPTDGSVTAIGAFAFDGMDGLTSISIPNSIKEIGSSAFQNCTGLTSVHIPAGVTTISGWAFSGCTGLTDIHCAVSSQPSGWNANWLAKCDATVHWSSATCSHSRTSVSTKAATCTATGTKTTVCSDCGVVLSTETIAKKEHTPKTTTVAATCTENGSKTTVCSVCGKQISKETIPLKGHDPKTSTTAATCTKTGTEKTVCRTCGKTLSTTTLPVLGHDYQGGSCTRCGKAEPACSHTNVTEYTDPATCEEDGTKLTVCSSCGKQVSKETIPAKGHSQQERVAPSSCIETGITTTYCETCNQILGIDTLPLAPHTYEDGVCTVCGAEEQDEPDPPSQDTSDVSGEESENPGEVSEEDSGEPSEDEISESSGEPSAEESNSPSQSPADGTEDSQGSDSGASRKPLVAWIVTGVFFVILVADGLCFVLYKEKKE